MFDIGFLELLVIGAVALVVVGPDRLPEVARTAGLWLGRIKRTFGRFRSELEKEIGADEIRQQLHNEAILEQLQRTKQDIEHTGQEISVNIDPKAPDKPSGTSSDSASNTADEAEKPKSSSDPNQTP